MAFSILTERLSDESIGDTSIFSPLATSKQTTCVSFSEVATKDKFVFFFPVRVCAASLVVETRRTCTNASSDATDVSVDHNWGQSMKQLICRFVFLLLLKDALALILWLIDNKLVLEMFKKK